MLKLRIALLAALVWIWIIYQSTDGSGSSNKQGVTTECFPTHIQISLQREYFTGVNMSGLHMRGHWCTSSGNSTHVIFKAPLYGCEMQFVDTNEFYVLMNVIRGVSPSISVKCFYPKQSANESAKDQDNNSGESFAKTLKFTAQLNMYQDSALTHPFPPGSFVTFGPSMPQELFFDLQINSKGDDSRICLDVNFCSLRVRNEDLSMIKNGLENKLATRVLFKSDQRVTFKFNTSFLTTSFNLINSGLKVFCLVRGYHDNKTDLHGNHSDQYHGNTSGNRNASRIDSNPYELKENSARRSKRFCTCIKISPSKDEHNRIKDSCNGNCVNGSTTNVTSYNRHSREKQTKRSMKDEKVGEIKEDVEQPLNDFKNVDARKTVKQVNVNHRQDLSQDDASSSSYSNNTHSCTCYDIENASIEQCSSLDWTGEPLSLQIEREWTTRSSLKIYSNWLDEDDVYYAEQNPQKDLNPPVIIEELKSKKEKSTPPAVILACLYLSLVLVIAPVLSIYLWDRRKQRKRRRDKRRGMHAGSSSNLRLVVERE